MSSRRGSKSSGHRWSLPVAGRVRSDTALAEYAVTWPVRATAEARTPARRTPGLGERLPEQFPSEGSGPVAAGPPVGVPVRAVFYSHGMASDQAGVRIDSWIWSVRLTKTRSQATAACRAGHVRINNERVKPSHPVRVGDEVRLRHLGRERIVVVTRLVSKRVGAAVAAECLIDKSPPPAPAEIAIAGRRDRGAGRPTKRDRRALERLQGRARR